LIFVVDASVAVLWFVEEPGHRKAVTIAESPNQLIAPDLIFPEVGNVLRRKVRSGLIAEPQATIRPESRAGLHADHSVASVD